jgi:hypothetical protein
MGRPLPQYPLITVTEREFTPLMRRAHELSSAASLLFGSAATNDTDGAEADLAAIRKCVIRLEKLLHPPTKRAATLMQQPETHVNAPLTALERTNA